MIGSGLMMNAAETPIFDKHDSDTNITILIGVPL